MKQSRDKIELMADWLDALAVVKEIGLERWVKPLYAQVQIDWCPAPILPIVRTYRLGSRVSQRNYKAELHPDFLDIPYRVERVEIMCYVAAAASVWMFDFAPELDRTCRLLGCAPTATATIRERWRRIQLHGTSTSLHSAVAEKYDDRPQCGWCKGALVTGSLSKSRPDLHQGCYNYIVTDVKPRLQRAKLAQENE